MVKKKSASSKGSSKKKATTPKQSRAVATIVGDYPEWPRIPLGLYSVDIALADVDFENPGFPVPCNVEVYGPESVGKSTFIYYITGKIAYELDGKIVLGDFDGFEPSFLGRAFGAGGYGREVQVYTEGAAETIFENLMDYFDANEECAVCGIVDSVSAVIPEAEAEGDMSGRNMGARAFLMAKLARKGTKMHRERRQAPTVIFASNHAYQRMGSFGSKTAGGDVYPNLAGVRLRLFRGLREDSWDGSFQVRGKVEKFKFGPRYREFQFFVQSGHGVHPGLTAVIDCIEQGYAECSSKTTIGRVTMEEKKYGWFKNLVAKGDDLDRFKPFINKLYG